MTRKTDFQTWADGAGEAFSALGDHIGVWNWDFSDGTVVWSRRLLTMLDQPHDTKMSFERFLELMHPDDRDSLRARIEAHLQGGAPYSLVVRLRRGDGTYIHCRTEGAAVFDASGEATSMVGVASDVTKEVQANARLNESEQRLATLADGFEGAIFRYRINADGTDGIDYMSQGAERVWGLKAHEIIGDPGKVWSTVHPDDVRGVEQAFASGTAQLSRLTHSWRVVLPDGVHRWIECRASPTRLANGDTLWDGFVIDISKTMRAREELQTKTEMLGQAQKLEAVGRIAGGIAHDFNNLLGIILGSSELIGLQQLPVLDQEPLHASHAACSRGADLTRRLLSFARQSQLEPQRVDLASIVEGMIPLIRRTLPANIAIHRSLTEESRAIVNVDVGLLESSILNLAVNARDAMVEGGELTLRLSENAPEGGLARRFVLLEIIDTGSGIDPELLPHVTAPFVTSKGPEMGSGLGLAMVDGFVDQSGGVLKIVSTPGEGTSIELYIPLAEGQASPEATLGLPAGDDLRFAGRILLVEDQRELRLVMSRHLRNLGLQVDAAENGPEALELLGRRGEEYVALVSDIVMTAKPDGVELARRFQTRFPDKPAILMSGYNEREVPARLVGDAPLERLAKPVSRERLVDALARLLAD